MPGFGFSTPLVGDGWTMARVAQTYDTLMRRQGYESYGTHGSDGGAMVSRVSSLCWIHPASWAHVLQLSSLGDPSEFERFGPRSTRPWSFSAGSSRWADTTR